MSEGDDHTTGNLNIEENKTDNKLSLMLEKAKSRSCEFVSENLYYIKSSVINNYYLNLPFKIVRQCNCKNTITIGNKTFKYTDRKIIVIGLSLGTAIFNCMRSNSSFKFRWLIPYYVFFSILFCRENLNPFL